jgi:hypothetical protein
MPTSSTNSYSVTMRGSVLPAVMLLTLAGSMLAISALQSAITETSLGATIGASQDAFMLAELGIESAMAEITRTPTALPSGSPAQLNQLTIANKGRVSTIVHPGPTDDSCALAESAVTERRHFEIHATATADVAAVTTHVLGFYICTEICTTIYCEAAQSRPKRSYWKAMPGWQP